MAIIAGIIMLMIEIHFKIENYKLRKKWKNYIELAEMGEQSEI
jgi:hypothetical protein